MNLLAIVSKLIFHATELSFMLRSIERQDLRGRQV